MQSRSRRLVLQVEVGSLGVTPHLAASSFGGEVHPMGLEPAGRCRVARFG